MLASMGIASMPGHSRRERLSLRERRPAKLEVGHVQALRASLQILLSSRCPGAPGARLLNFLSPCALPICSFHLHVHLSDMYLYLYNTHPASLNHCDMAQVALLAPPCASLGSSPMSSHQISRPAPSTHVFIIVRHSVLCRLTTCSRRAIRKR
jgi:hypothetical protein